MTKYFINGFLVLATLLTIGCGGQYGTSVGGIQLKGMLEPAGGVRTKSLSNEVAEQPIIESHDEPSDLFISSVKITQNGSLSIVEGTPGDAPYIIIFVPLLIEATTPYGVVQNEQLITASLKLVSSDQKEFKVGWSQTFFSGNNKYKFELNRTDGETFAAAYEYLQSQLMKAVSKLVADGLAKSNNPETSKTYRIHSFEMQTPLTFSGEGSKWTLDLPSISFKLEFN